MQANANANANDKANDDARQVSVVDSVFCVQCEPEVAAFMPHPECESDGNDFWFYLLCDKKYVNANKSEYKMVIKNMTRCFNKFQQGACLLCQHRQQQQQQ